MKKEITTAKILHVTGRIDNDVPTIFVLFQNADDNSVSGIAFKLIDEHDQFLLKRLQELCHTNTIRNCINKKISIIYNTRVIVAFGNAFKDSFYRLNGSTRAFRAEEIMSHEEGTIIDFSKRTAPLGAGKQAVAI